MKLVAALLRQLVGDVEHAVQVVGDVYVPGGAFDLRQAIEQPQESRAQLVDVRAGLQQQRTHGATGPVEHGEHHVRRLEELVVAAERERLCIGERLLEAAGSLSMRMAIPADLVSCGDKPQSVQGAASGARPLALAFALRLAVSQPLGQRDDRNA